MFLYNAKVRLLGSLNNEVQKHDLTAAEIAVLQRIHGRDAVVDIVKVGEARKRNDRSERNRLMNIYQNGVSADGKTNLTGAAFIDSILGVGNPLPKAYVEPVVEDPAIAAPAEAIEAEEIVRFDAEGNVVSDEPEDAEPIKRTVGRKPKAAATEDPLAA
jgi:hypothetical protein